MFHWRFAKIFKIIATFQNVLEITSRTEASWVVGHRQSVQIHHHDSHHGSLIWTIECVGFDANLTWEY